MIENLVLAADALTPRNDGMSYRYRQSVRAPLVTARLTSALLGLRRLTAHITNNARRKPSRL
jgi:hypothetical protein